MAKTMTGMEPWQKHEHKELMEWAHGFCLKRLDEKLDPSEHKYYTTMLWNIEMGPKFRTWQKESVFQGLQWLKISLNQDDRFRHYVDEAVVAETCTKV